MSIFNLPKTHDEFFTIQFLLFFLIGFCINVYSNGQATLIFIENEYSIKPGDVNYYMSEQYQTIQEYTNKVKFRDNWVYPLILILYWGVSPLLNFYYGFFVFKKNQWKQKDLNISDVSNK